MQGTSSDAMGMVWHSMTLVLSNSHLHMAILNRKHKALRCSPSGAYIGSHMLTLPHAS